MNSYSCRSCRRYGGGIVAGKVRCRPRGLREPPEPGSCGGWVGGDELEGYPMPAEERKVKKWA